MKKSLLIFFASFIFLALGQSVSADCRTGNPLCVEPQVCQWAGTTGFRCMDPGTLPDVPAPECIDGSTCDQGEICQDNVCIADPSISTCTESGGLVPCGRKFTGGYSYRTSTPGPQIPGGPVQEDIITNCFTTAAGALVTFGEIHPELVGEANCNKIDDTCNLIGVGQRTYRCTGTGADSVGSPFVSTHYIQADSLEEARSQAGNDNPVTYLGDMPICPCQLRHVFVLILRIYNFIVWTIAPILTVMFIVIGGALLVVSGANPGWRSRGWDMIKWSLLATALIFSSWLIIDIVLKAIGYTGAWNTFNP